MMYPKKINELLNDLGVEPIKSKGQNFLVDSIIAKQIVDSCVFDRFQHFLEVGVGLGALTHFFYQKPVSFVGIDLEKKFIKYLNHHYPKKDNFLLAAADFLQFESFSFLLEPNRNYHLVANLPYVISTDCLFQFLKLERFEVAVLMLQKEYVARIISPSGTANYSKLSVLVQTFCDVKNLFLVPAAAFYPVPQVDSAVVYLAKKKPSVWAFFAQYARFLQICFCFRRKTLFNNLKNGFCIEKIKQVFLVNNININVRAQDLKVEEFVFLFEKLVLDQDTQY